MIRIVTVDKAFILIQIHENGFTQIAVKNAVFAFIWCSLRILVALVARKCKA